MRARPKQRDLEPVADFDRDDDDAVDEREAGERDARREPELAARLREVVAQRRQLRHRIGARLRAGIERLDERELVEVREIRRDDERRG